MNKNEFLKDFIIGFIKIFIFEIVTIIAILMIIIAILLED